MLNSNHIKITGIAHARYFMILFYCYQLKLIPLSFFLRNFRLLESLTQTIKVCISKFF